MPSTDAVVKEKRKSSKSKKTKDREKKDEATGGLPEAAHTKQLAHNKGEKNKQHKKDAKQKKSKKDKEKKSSSSKSSSATSQSASDSEEASRKAPKNKPTKAKSDRKKDKPYKADASTAKCKPTKRQPVKPPAVAPKDQKPKAKKDGGAESSSANEAAGRAKPEKAAGKDSKEGKEKRKHKSRKSGKAEPREHRRTPKESEDLHVHHGVVHKRKPHTRDKKRDRKSKDRRPSVALDAPHKPKDDVSLQVNRDQLVRLPAPVPAAAAEPKRATTTAAEAYQQSVSLSPDINSETVKKAEASGSQPNVVEPPPPEQVFGPFSSPEEKPQKKRSDRSKRKPKRKQQQQPDQRQPAPAVPIPEQTPPGTSADADQPPVQPKRSDKPEKAKAEQEIAPPLPERESDSESSSSGSEPSWLDAHFDRQVEDEQNQLKPSKQAGSRSPKKTDSEDSTRSTEMGAAAGGTAPPPTDTDRYTEESGQDTEPEESPSPYPYHGRSKAPAHYMTPKPWDTNPLDQAALGELLSALHDDVQSGLADSEHKTRRLQHIDWLHNYNWSERPQPDEEGEHIAAALHGVRMDRALAVQVIQQALRWNSIRPNQCDELLSELAGVAADALTFDWLVAALRRKQY